MTRKERLVLHLLFGIPPRLLRLPSLVLRTRRGEIEGYLNRPQAVEIETLAYCNAQCRMCPIPRMKRARGVMSENLFKKIVDELVQIKPREVSPFNDGEPLLDKNLIKRIALINQALPGTEVSMFTNASLLTRERVLELNSVRVDKINLSLNAGSKESYQKIMKPLDYDRVLENIQTLLELKRPGTKVVVSMIRLPENRGEDAAFRTMWEGKGVETAVWNPTDFGGEVGLLQRQRLRRRFDFLLPPAPCLTALIGMTILHDGRVSLCSRDFEGEVILGDVSKDSLLAIWNSAPAREIRMKHLAGKRNQIRMCRGCPGYNLPLETLFEKA